MHLRRSWEVSGRLCGGRWEVLVRFLVRLMGQPGRFLGCSCWEGGCWVFAGRLLGLLGGCWQEAQPAAACSNLLLVAVVTVVPFVLLSLLLLPLFR